MFYLMKCLSRSRTGPRRSIGTPFQRGHKSRGMFFCVCESRITLIPRRIAIGG
jgi:hypothetical protein